MLPKKQTTNDDSILRTEKRTVDGIDYCYHLSVRESRQVSGYRLPLYSVSVEMTAQDSGTTRADVRDYFADAGKAILFFEKVVDHLATPIDLRYILEDEMS